MEADTLHNRLTISAHATEIVLRDDIQLKEANIRIYVIDRHENFHKPSAHISIFFANKLRDQVKKK